MRKTGIFLGFNPGANLSNEGIGRLLAFLLKESNTNNKDIVLFCPEWLKHSISSLMKDNKIPQSKFEVVSTGSIPLGVRLKDYLLKRRTLRIKNSKRNNLVRRLKQNVISLFKRSITDFFSTTNLFMAFLKLLGYLFVVVCAIPFLLVFILLFFVYKILKVVYRLSKKVIPYSWIDSKLRLLLEGSQGKIYQLVLAAELSKVARMINKRKDIDACYIPSMVWPQIRELRCKKILAAPDIVFYDFPTQFPGVKGIHQNIRGNIKAADHLICYSDHVKYHHLVEKCGVSPEKITVIKHANIDMAEHLKMSKHVKTYLSFEQNAKQIIDEYIQTNFSPNHVLYNSDFRDIDFITYSSQYRSHKNIFNLIKAVKIINKEMHGNVKLFLTGDYEVEKAIKEYVTENQLNNDIFIFFGISSTLLAALNSLARLAVNPTLFEGGFPFTFSEAFSVGTPSIMSDIPVVNSEIDNEELKDQMLFNPYDPYCIAEKILQNLENPNSLYESQKKLYNHFNERDWKTVANQYKQVFNQSL
ncbi:glycosyltransferase [Paenibacillus sp. NPDC058177]|uniref:glycosyltransferase n=1 Tax=Paenibacillus sp. NPDC058177 TaxID=3346369 RepID=UPI0036DDD654